MPALPDGVLDAVVFLYDTPDSARRGGSDGGTGWLLLIPLETGGARLYVVTCRHVVATNWRGQPGSPVVRVNTREGGADVFPFKESEWFMHESADLAIHPIDLFPERHRCFFHGRHHFLTENDVADYGIGVGDEAFSIGRFVDLQDQPQNMPVVRFGNVALMPPTRIDGQELLLVEMRSRTGYSGSPVFVYVDPAAIRWKRGNENLYTQVSSETFGPWILGTQRGQMKVTGPELELQEQEQTGMATVVPIRKLEELLERKDVVDERRKYESSNPQVSVEEASRPHRASDLTGDDILRNMLNMPPDPRKPPSRRTKRRKVG